MNRVNRTLLAAALVGVINLPAAQAEMFGGGEVGYARDTNFNGAPEGAARLEENITSFTTYLGHYSPSANGRSAFIVKGDIQANRLEKTPVLDNNIFGVSAGTFHAFSRHNSMTSNLGVRGKRFDDSRRDGEVYALQFGFKQKMSDRFWFRQGLVGEYGTAEVKSGEYTGYGVSGSLNWKPGASTLLNLGLSWNRRVYDVPVADERTGKQLTLGLVQELGKHVYLRASATRLNNSANDGSEYDSNVYSVGLGFGL